MMFDVILFMQPKVNDFHSMKEIHRWQHLLAPGYTAEVKFAARNGLRSDGQEVVGSIPASDIEPFEAVLASK